MNIYLKYVQHPIKFNSRAKLVSKWRRFEIPKSGKPNEMQKDVKTENI